MVLSQSLAGVVLEPAGSSAGLKRPILPFVPIFLLSILEKLLCVKDSGTKLHAG